MWDEPSVVLVISAFFTATLSGMMGMGGGILLLTVMMNYFPPAVLIPLHGSVQFISNIFRTAINIGHLVKSIFLPALLGAIVGGAIASQVVVELPENVFRWIIGVFVLILTWVPFKKLFSKTKADRKKKFFAIGIGATFISVFVGATGPLLAPFFLHEKLDRRQIVATKAGVQFCIHLLKISVFFASGFVFSKYMNLLLMMSAVTLLGTYLGKRLLGLMSDKIFYWVFKGLITILALRFLYKSLF